MVVAMLAGMLVAEAAAQPLGVVPRGESAGLVFMFAAMTLGMSAWMIRRRHRTRDTLAMAIAGNLPLLIVLPLLRSDTISSSLAGTLAYGAMLAGMAAVACAAHTHLRDTSR